MLKYTFDAMKIWQYVLIVLVALITGVGVAVYRIASIGRSPAFATYGSWRGTADLPLNKNNLVTTQVTLFALFALPGHEAVYLFATEDDKIESLKGDARYSIRGNIHDINAGYWSITAYGNDLYLIPNSANRYSVNNKTVQTDKDGNFEITVAPIPPEENLCTNMNWLPVKQDARFRLVLRLYDADKNFISNLQAARLPLIKKLAK